MPDAPDNIVAFTGVTTLDCPPDRVISAALGKMEAVVIVGRHIDGSEYFASSVADGGDVLWMMERAKKALLETPDRD